MGSRNEVLDTPFIEALSILSMQLEKEKQISKEKMENIKMNYLSLVHSQPLDENAKPQQKKARKDFLDMLFPEMQPDSDESKRKANEKRKKFRWSEETERKMLEVAEQEREGIE